MLIAEGLDNLLSRVRQIEIRARGLSQNVFAGAYHSAFRGRGMSFSEVREYVAGDDVRDIDWKVTARFGHPYVKVYEEERELTVMLLIDTSRSLDFGTRVEEGRVMVAEIAATLAFSAMQNNDKVGALFFSDTVEQYITPKKGRKHVLHIIREILSFESAQKGTQIQSALSFLLNTQKKRSTAFLLSDFLDETEAQKELRTAARKHDLVAVQVYDRWMEELPRVGLLRVEDAETGYELLIDTSSRRQREQHRRYWLKHQARLSDSLARAGVDMVSVRTDGDYVQELMKLFSRRNRN